MSDSGKSQDEGQAIVSVQLGGAIVAALDAFAEQHALASRPEAIRRILETWADDFSRASDTGIRPEELNASNDG
jgi:metal-responsive CopG/Arc/MetJ family transcriptional regulator